MYSKKKSDLILGARILRFIGALALPFAARATAQTISEIHTPGFGTVIAGTTTQWMQFPRAISFDIDSGGTTIKKILLNWQTNKDVVQFPMWHGRGGSTDGGVTWNAPALDQYYGYPPAPDFDMMCSIRRRDGTAIAVPFFPNNGTLGTSFTFTYRTSTDNGVTWQTNTNGVCAFSPNSVSSFRWHRGILEDSDGTLYAPASVVLSGDSYHRIALTQSTDGGVHWTRTADIKNTSGIEAGECSVVVCKNGSWLAVWRSSLVGSSTPRNLQYARSTNKGLTWTASADLPGLPANAGVDPELCLMPDGVLVLTYGDDMGAARRDILLAFSADGNGTNWSNVTPIFEGNSGVLESTGYTSVVALSAQRLQLYSDTGANAYYATEHPDPNPFKIRASWVDIVLSNRNRIDLARKNAAGTVTITTDMTMANGAHPEMRSTGAFDSSVDYWSGAFKAATSGSYTIDLQQTYVLTAVGVSLQYGVPESATVEYSTNGSTWTTAKTYTNATHYALDYTSLASVSARYVRVTASSATSPVALGEIELYSRADTFENWIPGVAPAAYTGYTVPVIGGVHVAYDGVSNFGYQSQRALQVYDNDSGAERSIKKAFTAATTKTLEFTVKPSAYASGGASQWRFNSGSTIAFRLRTSNSGGQIQYYNGSAYVNVSGAFAPINTWTKIKIVADASTDTATLFVNGVQMGATGSIGHENVVSSFDSFSFHSGGIGANGDLAYFDDVDVY